MSITDKAIGGRAALEAAVERFSERVSADPNSLLLRRHGHAANRRAPDDSDRVRCGRTGVPRHSGS